MLKNLYNKVIFSKKNVPLQTETFFNIDYEQKF